MTKLKKPPVNPITARRKFRNTRMRVIDEANDFRPDQARRVLDWSRTQLNPDKGLKGGSCNRTACQRPGANYYNYSTQKYYCRDCAEDLNRANRLDAHKMYGHDLCLLDTSNGPL